MLSQTLASLPLGLGCNLLASGEEVAIVAVCIGGVIAVATIVAGHWRRVRLGEYDAHLKRMMLERGMSAAEIERVLAAGEGGERKKTEC